MPKYRSNYNTIQVILVNVQQLLMHCHALDIKLFDEVIYCIEIITFQ